jgi:hypothetical protein
MRCTIQTLADHQQQRLQDWQSKSSQGSRRAARTDTNQNQTFKMTTQTNPHSHCADGCGRHKPRQSARNAPAVLLCPVCIQHGVASRCGREVTLRDSDYGNNASCSKKNFKILRTEAHDASYTRTIQHHDPSHGSKPSKVHNAKGNAKQPAGATAAHHHTMTSSTLRMSGDR